MVVLPYEIWLHITSYLTRDEIWDLRHLNPALLDIAMDTHYKTLEVSMTFRESKRYIRDFIRFRDPDIAKRVRHVLYYPHAITVFPKKKPMKTTPSSIKRRFRTMFVKHRPTDADMVETVASFTNVVSLEIRCIIFDWVTFFPECVTFIHTNFRTCHSHLQSLVFSFNMAHFSLVILPDLFLPSLTSLSITFFGSTAETPFEGVATTTIVPFINRHRSTLSSLVFRVLAGENFDMAFLFQGIDQIAALKSIFVCISPSTRPLFIARFLEMHRNTLQTITIGLMQRPYHRVDEIFQDVHGEFPKLEDFSVQCWGYRRVPSAEPNLGPTLEFIKRCSSSLVSVNIIGGAQDTTKLLELLKPPGRRTTPFVKLRSLHMALRYFTPEVLALFVAQLPDLHTLELSVSSLNHQESLEVSYDDSREFYRSLLRRNYMSWRLEHLTLLLENSSPFSWPPDIVNPMVFERILPNLKTFNGRTTNKHSQLPPFIP